ncbi:Protein of unknown function [Allochromatium warmingii]|uniref:Glycosyltransferase 61 catalytic domain-containing protein n=1 Tax=Allochromatium warmingii TaxID=61595 RepID=A0A1H3E1N8_ALLWA|nr:glycosyltransferase family 61 protein [Allochromatium warmingii]SDX72595.1 Protein of unknown function [Allochromatium warmingii]
MLDFSRNYSFASIEDYRLSLESGYLLDRFNGFIPYIRYIPTYVGPDPAFIGEIRKQPQVFMVEDQSTILPALIQFDGQNFLIQPLGSFSSKLFDDRVDLVLVGNLQNAEKKVDLSDKIIVPLVSKGFNIYGHFLIDLMPRLKMYSAINNVSKFVGFIAENAPDWSIEMASACIRSLNGELEFMKKDVAYLCNVYVPMPSRYHDYLAPCSVFGGDLLTQRNFITPSRKVYISRSRWKNKSRDLMNREEVEKVFADGGFDIVSPEDLSFQDQLKVFASAKILAGEAGSGLHNVVFSNAFLTINVNSSRQSHFIQAGLSRYTSSSSIYLYGESQDQGWNSPFTVDLDCAGELVGGLP